MISPKLPADISDAGAAQAFVPTPERGNEAIKIGIEKAIYASQVVAGIKL